LSTIAGHLGRQFFHLLGARVLTREKDMLIERHGDPFLKLARLPASSPSRPSERTRGELRRREHGTTDRLALPHQPKKSLLRPSVQLPAGIHGCAPYKGFDRHGKGKRPWRHRGRHAGP